MKSLRKVFKIIELLANNKETRLQEIADELVCIKVIDMNFHISIAETVGNILLNIRYGMSGSSQGE
jgi:hypothetical protein